jgi:hypothetical protein
MAAALDDHARGLVARAKFQTMLTGQLATGNAKFVGDCQNA